MANTVLIGNSTQSANTPPSGVSVSSTIPALSSGTQGLKNTSASVTLPINTLWVNIGTSSTASPSNTISNKITPELVRSTQEAYLNTLNTGSMANTVLIGNSTQSANTPPSGVSVSRVNNGASSAALPSSTVLNQVTPQLLSGTQDAYLNTLNTGSMANTVLIGNSTQSANTPPSGVSVSGTIPALSSGTQEVYNTTGSITLPINTLVVGNGTSSMAPPSSTSSNQITPELVSSTQEPYFNSLNSRLLTNTVLIVNSTQSANTMPSGVWGENTLPTLSGGTHAPPLSSASVTFPINTLGVTNGTSMSNTIIDIVNQTSTFATTLSTLNAISAIPVVTTREILSSIMLSSVPSSTLSSTVSSSFPSTVSQRLPSSSSSASSISINTESNTMNTHLLSAPNVSQTGSSATVTSSVETETISNWLYSLHTMSKAPSTSSSLNVGYAESTNNPSLPTGNTVFLTSTISKESFSKSSTESMITIGTTGYLSSLSSPLESDTTTQRISTSTPTVTVSHLVSLLLTTSNVSISNETFGVQNTISSFPFTTETVTNTTNAIPSTDCVFPFLYLGQWYERCISDSVNDSWCSLTSDFDRDHQWKYCQAPRIKTMGGTGNGSYCVFPFVYQGTSFSRCIYRTVTTQTTTSFSLFCSVTSNLDQHGLWGYCLDYDSCYFPFIYNGITYSDCVSGPQSARWCSTTVNFDRNKMWSNCPGML
ncbi:unnamed protein product [Rotaria socialis]|uniref:Fibronectin type-II domain-containing protein n=2 Tax=Rotaria socialis TaxID=392032 RepID=A0A819BRR0_9BILA|nr:unnamed protein product [Rotaria socialis]